MKILTVNMCMEAGDVQRRMDALGKLVQATRPEFVALQSVTHDMVKRFLTTPWGTRYKASLPPIKYETRGKPSVAILSTYPAEKSTLAVFRETAAHKVYFRAFFVMHDKHKQPHFINLCTTHLDTGMDMTEVRELQLNEALLTIKDSEDCFVVGDFSLTDLDGKLCLQSEWKDAWVELNGEGGDTGNTVDPDSNPLLRGSVSRGRPDRILYRVCRYKLDSVEVVAREPVSGVGVHVSPHFAVLSSFSILDPSAFHPYTEPGPVPCVFERAQWSVSFQSNQ